jgi:asparagine synthase (glutamine-hydrolysing)
VSDVDIDSYLSGGMDSADNRRCGAAIAPYAILTCGGLNSASGVELGFDESTAEYMSYLFKTEHYEMVLKAGDMERVMPRLVCHLEERGSDKVTQISTPPNWRQVREVVLSGAGVTSYSRLSMAVLPRRGQ